jgi:hypothetical protein
MNHFCIIQILPVFSIDIHDNLMDHHWRIGCWDVIFDLFVSLWYIAKQESLEPPVPQTLVWSNCSPNRIDSWYTWILIIQMGWISGIRQYRLISVSTRYANQRNGSWDIYAVISSGSAVQLIHHCKRRGCNVDAILDWLSSLLYIAKWESHEPPLPRTLTWSNCFTNRIDGEYILYKWDGSLGLDSMGHSCE